MTTTTTNKMLDYLNNYTSYEWTATQNELGRFTYKSGCFTLVQLSSYYRDAKISVSNGIATLVTGNPLTGATAKAKLMRLNGLNIWLTLNEITKEGN